MVHRFFPFSAGTLKQWDTRTGRQLRAADLRSGQEFRPCLFHRRCRFSRREGVQIFAGRVGCRLGTKASGIEGGQGQWRTVTGLRYQPRWTDAGDEYRVDDGKCGFGRIDVARRDQWAGYSDDQNLGTEADDDGVSISRSAPSGSLLMGAPWPSLFREDSDIPSLFQAGSRELPVGRTRSECGTCRAGVK